MHELIGHAGQQALAERRFGGIEPAAVALVRHVGKAAVGAHDAAIRSFEHLERVGGVQDERVLVGMNALRLIRVAVLCQVRERRAAIARQQHRAGVRFGAELVVAERAGKIDYVRMAGRRDDDVVVPALRGAVADILRGGDVGKCSRT